MRMLLRNLKPVYRLYSFLQKNKLQQLGEKYRLLGMNKRSFDPVHFRDFKHADPAVLKEGKSYPDVTETRLYKNLNESSQKSLREFSENGFAILRRYLYKETAGQINTQIEEMKDRRKIDVLPGGKVMSADRASLFLKSVSDNEELNELISALMQGNSVFYQSINYLKGVEKPLHTDSTYLSTFPKCGSISLWAALEDTDEAKGPVVFYPKSHLLADQFPQFLGKRTGKNNDWIFRKIIEENKLEKQLFYAKKGDVLIRHANLIHGKMAQTNPRLSGRSMVMQYFDSDCICFHEITGRPAILDF